MKIISWNIGNFIFAKHFPDRKHYSFYYKKTTIFQQTVELLIELQQKQKIWPKKADSKVRYGSLCLFF